MSRALSLLGMTGSRSSHTVCSFWWQSAKLQFICAWPWVSGPCLRKVTSGKYWFFCCLFVLFSIWSQPRAFQMSELWLTTLPDFEWEFPGTELEWNMQILYYLQRNTSVIKYQHKYIFKWKIMVKRPPLPIDIAVLHFESLYEEQVPEVN